MEEHNIKINVPEGYELQWNKEHTEVEVVKKVEDYNEIAKVLFTRNHVYYSTSNGLIGNFACQSSYASANNALSPEQLIKMYTFNKLMNVARYLNGDWQPNWKSSAEKKWYIMYDYPHSSYCVDMCWQCDSGRVIFKTKELAERAIQIMGPLLDKLFKNNI